MSKTTEERFDEKWVARGDGCHEWTACRDSHGYGRFRLAGRQGRTVLSHRFAYERRYGRIPSGLEPDHLCRRPWCINPDHLEMVTHQVNVRRGNSPSALISRSGLCAKGHPVKSYGCSICQNERQKTKRILARPRVTSCCVCASPMPDPQPGHRPREKYCSPKCHTKGSTMMRSTNRNRLNTLEAGEVAS